MPNSKRKRHDYTKNVRRNGVRYSAYEWRQEAARSLSRTQYSPTGANLGVRNRLWESQNGRCARCPIHMRRQSEQWHIHHVVASENGGSDDLSNLQLLCSSCHWQEHHS